MSKECCVELGAMAPAMSKDIPTKAYIDDANKALIVRMRNEACSWKEITDAAFKADGANPTKKGCREVIRRWNKPKAH